MNKNLKSKISRGKIALQKWKNTDSEFPHFNFEIFELSRLCYRKYE